MRVKQKEHNREKLNLLLDEELLQFIQEGDGQALELLIKRYKSFILSKANTYFLIGGDREDITQEGMIGLYNAIRDYDHEKLSSFRAFADLCITRQIITAIKAATRQKHMPLNSSVSLHKPVYEGESKHILLDTIAETRVTTDPQELVIKQEKTFHIKLKLSEVLSDFEHRVLHLYLDGYSYQEISDELNRRVKSIDNALQRIKRKFDRFIDPNELTFS